MIINVIKYGDSSYAKLRSKNIDVKKENPFLNKLINDMFETIDSSSYGIGLSAPQVGYNLNLFVVKTTNVEEVFINPEIYLEGLNLQVKETCLSVPDLILPVDRRERVKIKFYDRNWVLRYCEYKENIAIIVQHEFDNINGKLIID